jgi:predicted dinucleotide-binding enzyme
LVADMTTIGFVGSGNIGGTVARLAVDAGHDVVLSNSRGPETMQDLALELGPHARAATAEEAAAAGDIIVVTIPFKNVDQVPTEPLRGKVVIDTCNYYPQRDGQVAELDDHSSTSSELVQRLIPGAHVVKAFNNIQYSHLGSLQRPRGDTDRSVLAIAGDDASAKAVATDFLDSIGYDAYDAGPLAESWRFEPGAPAYGAPYNAPGAGWPPPPGSGRQVTADEMRAKLAEATR